MAKNCAIPSEDKKCFYTFFASTAGKNISIKIKIDQKPHSSSRTAQLNFIKRMDNSG